MEKRGTGPVSVMINSLASPVMSAKTQMRMESTVTKCVTVNRASVTKAQREMDSASANLRTPANAVTERL